MCVEEIFLSKLRSLEVKVSTPHLRKEGQVEPLYPFGIIAYRCLRLRLLPWLTNDLKTCFNLMAHTINQHTHIPHIDIVTRRCSKGHVIANLTRYLLIERFNDRLTNNHADH